MKILTIYSYINFLYQIFISNFYINFLYQIFLYEYTNIKMHDVNIIKSANVSLILQIITALIDLLALNFDIKEEDQILKDLLILELLVQVIEGSFYIWMINSFSKLENITKYRYYDWSISTPAMLLTLVLYLIYLRYSEELKNSDNINKKDIIPNFFKLIKENWENLITIIILNELMLLFGYLYEIGKLSKTYSVILGFIPFIMMFKIIYDNYAKYTESGMFMFKYFVIVWGLYGFAALFPYSMKNISYNILDLFSKNFFGLFLSYNIYVNRIKY
jgi:hypothetical protein